MQMFIKSIMLGLSIFVYLVKLGVLWINVAIDSLAMVIPGL